LGERNYPKEMRVAATFKLRNLLGINPNATVARGSSPAYQDTQLRPNAG